MATFKIENKWRKRFMTLAIVLLSFVVLVLLLDRLVMPWVTHHGEATILPKVVGRTVDDAVRILQQAGYEPIKYETQYDQKAPEGTIIRQTPEGGDETKPGRKVYLIISGGKEMVTIPNLVGVPLKDARIILVRANLDLGKQTLEFSDSVASGSIIRQSPPAGSKISTAQKVDIVVSNGSQAGKVAVPNLTGLTEERAFYEIGNAKLGVGQRNFSQPLDNQKPGTIIDQYPKPGELVLIGTPIDLYIAKEKAANPGENEN